MKAGELTESGMEPMDLPVVGEGWRADRVRNEAYGVTRILREGRRADRVKDEA